MSVAATSPGRSWTRDAHVPRADAGNDLRMADRPIDRFAQVAAEPGHAFALDDVVGVDPLGQVRDVGDVPADDDLRIGLILADQRAHLRDLSLIGNDRGDAHHVVLLRAKLLDESLQRGEVEHGARGLDVRGNEHDPPTAVEHPQGEGALGASDLVVIQLHRVQPAAAVLVVHAVGAEDAGQKDLRPLAQRMNGDFLRAGRLGVVKVKVLFRRNHRRSPGRKCFEALICICCRRAAGCHRRGGIRGIISNVAAGRNANSVFVV